MTDETTTFTIQPGQYLGKLALERLLARWTPMPGQDAASLYLRPGQAADYLPRSGLEGAAWWERLSALDDAVVTSDTGIIALRVEGQARVILPPFPVQENRLSAEWDTSNLLGLLSADYTLGVVLLRLGRYSVAVYQGDALVSSKTDSRYVKGRHSAGGTSQLRYQRIREGQIRQLYDHACQVVRSQFTPYGPLLDYIFLGGERQTLNGFLKVCPYLEQFKGIILGRRLNVRDPKRDTLEQVGLMLRESRVYPLAW